MNARPGTEKQVPLAKKIDAALAARKRSRHTSKMTEQAFGQPAWKAQRASGDHSVRITPCEPLEMRLMEVRIPWSSFVEDSDRKNMFFELRDPTVRAYLHS